MHFVVKNSQKVWVYGPVEATAEIWKKSAQ